MILGHTLDRFTGYFNNSWIDLKNGQVVQIARAHSNPSTVVLINKDGDGQAVDLKDLTWEQVQPKELGYRNVGKYLYYFDKKAGRNTSKGISNRTITGTRSISTLCWAGNDAECNAADKMLALFYPNFPPARQAIDDLLNPAMKSALGIAVSSNCALVLDPSRDGVVLLLMQEQTVGELIQGRWQWLVPHAKDVAVRLNLI